jgi:hypothetical protein
MRILLDHNTPAPLRHSLQGHNVETAYECGWAELTNGELMQFYLMPASRRTRPQTPGYQPGSFLIADCRHPDIAGPLAHVEYDLVACHRHVQSADCDVEQRSPGLVSMKYRNRLA